MKLIQFILIILSLFLMISKADFCDEMKIKFNCPVHAVCTNDEGFYFQLL